MTVLSIETSCDETAAAVITDGTVRSNVISSQAVHGTYGGVVPELASRAHIRLITPVVSAALTKAGVEKSDLDGVAATYGPGLAGALLVGLSYGKAIACALGIPFVGVNHLEGHLYSNFLTSRRPEYPFIALIVSGGHTLLVRVTEPFVHEVLGSTRDDAAGEAFDKVAKMLGLEYPGGPVIDRLAKEGDPEAVRFPRSYLEEGSYDFSFSGLKTSVLYYLRRNDLKAGGIQDGLLRDICAGFQEAVVDVLVKKTIDAAVESAISEITVGGGVSANSLLRARLESECTQHGFNLFYPPLEYCMDNAAMIGYVGWLRMSRGFSSELRLNVEAGLSL